MNRTVGWFSCGAASAIACALAHPDVVAYCETGSEHADNARFLVDCEQAFGWKVERLRSEKYGNTWDVWESRGYLAGIHGAPCTKELKIKPRLEFQRPDDVHVFGFTAEEAGRADALRKGMPDLTISTPLIEQGITKAACIAMLRSSDIIEPLTYAMGLPNANCLPCVKATSPKYWSLIRQEFPEKFERMVRLSRKLNVRLTRLNGERAFIDEIPEGHPTTEPLAPECDLLCQLRAAPGGCVAGAADTVNPQPPRRGGDVA